MKGATIAGGKHGLSDFMRIHPVRADNAFQPMPPCGAA